MNIDKYFYRIFGHIEFISVIVRVYYTLVIILFFLNGVSVEMFTRLINIMFMPLIVSLIGHYPCYVYANSLGYSIKDVGDMYTKHVLNIFKISLREANILQIICEIYKLLILVFIWKYVEFKIDYAILGSIFLIVYFTINRPDITYLGKKFKYNNWIVILIVLVTSGSCYFFSDKKNQKFGGGHM